MLVFLAFKCFDVLGDRLTGKRAADGVNVFLENQSRCKMIENRIEESQLEDRELFDVKMIDSRNLMF